MADIILVQPRIGYWDTMRSHLSIPLALLAASRLVQKKFSVIIIDTRLHNNWQEQLISELKQKPACVGITSMTGSQIKYALEISKAVKAHSAVPVVWGGIHASIFPRETLGNEYVDFVIKGEGEQTLLDFVTALTTECSYKDIPGLWYKESGEIRNGGERKFCNLDKLGNIPYHLLEPDHYFPLFMGRRTMHFETSRGCPNACTYCYNKSYNERRWRAVSPDTVVEQLKEVVQKQAIKSFYVIDDNFFVDLDRAREICAGIIKHNLDIYWEAQGITIESALKMDDNYLAMLEKSGLKKVHFGAETGSERILKLVRKNISAAEMRIVNEKFKQYNIVVQYNFMSGFPTETIEDIKATIQLIFDLMKGNPKALISPICPFTPYPGTELFDMAIQSGFKQRNTLEDWIASDYGENIWSSRVRMKLLQRLFFASMFLDTHRAKDMINSPILRNLIIAYRPIAKFRLKHMLFSFMPEMLINDLLLKK